MSRLAAGVGWALLGGFLLLEFGRPLLLRWVVVAGLPWLAGAILLRYGDFSVLTGSVRRALDSRAPRVATVILAGVLFAAVYLFGTAALVLLLTWAGVAVLALGTAGRDDWLRGALVNGTTLSVSLLVVGAALEATLRLPPVAEQWGAPSERQRAAQRYDGLWRTNMFGFRSEHEQVGRDPGTLRVLALGDSYTWGTLIADGDSTWPGRLERLLQDRRPEADVEVINMASQGYTTANEAELLRRLGWQFEPDLVIIQFFINDTFRSGPDLEHESGIDVFGWHNLLPYKFRQGRIRDSVLRRFLVRRFNRLVGEPVGQRMYPFYDESYEGWRQFRAALEEIGRAAAERETPVVFMLYPSLLPGSWTGETHPHAPLHRKVARAARDSGFRVLDLTPAFGARTRDPRQWWVRPYDAHPSAEAHALAARELARFLRDANLVRRAAASGGKDPTGPP